MSTVSSIISQINSLTGYSLPTASGIVISQSANPVGSGSVNQIISYINSLTGYEIPSTQVQYVSGSNVAGPVIIYTPYAAGGTIPTTGIAPGRVIQADHVLRIINALNGVNVDTIIISGSLLTSGSNVFNGSVSMPFIPSNRYLYTSNNGQVVGVYAPPSGSGGGTGSIPFLKSQTDENETEGVLLHQAIFNPASLTVVSSSTFIVDPDSYYYVLGDVVNEGSMEIGGTIKIGGALYNSGSITGTGIIE